MKLNNLIKNRNVSLILLEPVKTHIKKPASGVWGGPSTYFYDVTSFQCLPMEEEIEWGELIIGNQLIDEGDSLDLIIL